jgi:hypothetical protein
MDIRDRVTAAVSVHVEETVDYEVTFAHFGPHMNELGDPLDAR